MRRMRLAVGLVVVLGVLVWLILAKDTVVESLSPNEETITHTIKKDLRTGELHDVEIVKCRRCGEIISYIEFDRFGLPVGGYNRAGHICGRAWGKRDPRYQGSATGPLAFNFFGWLDQWQRRFFKQRGSR